jgi:acyl carrier protein
MSTSVDSDVRKIIRRQLNADDADLKPGTNFVEDLGADSLAVVELTMALEEAFDIEIPDGDATKILTVQNAIDYIGARLAPKATALT